MLGEMIVKNGLEPGFTFHAIIPNDGEMVQHP